MAIITRKVVRPPTTNKKHEDASLVSAEDLVRIEEHFRTEKKVPYRFTKEQIWGLHRKFTK